MDKFFKLEADNIAYKLSTIRRKLNISVRKLEEALIISKGTIANIEKGHIAKIETIVPLSYFFGMDLCELTNRNLSILNEPELRDKILKFHRENLIVDTDKLIHIPPTIKVLITDRMIPNGHFKKPLTLDDILDTAKTDFGGEFKKSSLERVLELLVKEKTLRKGKLTKTYSL